MTAERIQTELAGYATQVFPVGLEDLNTAYEHASFDSDDFWYLAEEVRGFQDYESVGPTTADGYQWLAGLSFQRDETGKKISILFPFIHDRLLGRSIGVYAEDGVPDAEVENLVDDLYCGLLSMARRPVLQP